MRKGQAEKTLNIFLHSFYSIQLYMIQLRMLAFEVQEVPVSPPLPASLIYLVSGLFGLPLSPLNCPWQVKEAYTYKIFSD